MDSVLEGTVQSFLATAQKTSYQRDGALQALHRGQRVVTNYEASNY
jgi:hypothetical protein